MRSQFPELPVFVGDLIYAGAKELDKIAKATTMSE
jgi:hypothetical protein